MPEFEVAGAHEFDGALVYWWREGSTDPVVVKIPTRTFEDVFHRPRAADEVRRRLTRPQCALLAESNLEPLGRIIAKEHAALAAGGEAEPRTLTLDAPAIERAGVTLSDSVLEMAARSGWMDPTSGVTVVGDAERT